MQNLQKISSNPDLIGSYKTLNAKLEKEENKQDIMNENQTQVILKKILEFTKYYNMRPNQSVNDAAKKNSLQPQQKYQPINLGITKFQSQQNKNGSKQNFFNNNIQPQNLLNIDDIEEKALQELKQLTDNDQNDNEQTEEINELGRWDTNKKSSETQILNFLNCENQNLKKLNKLQKDNLKKIENNKQYYKEFYQSKKVFQCEKKQIISEKTQSKIENKSKEIIKEQSNDNQNNQNSEEKKFYQTNQISINQNLQVRKSTLYPLQKTANSNRTKTKTMEYSNKQENKEYFLDLILPTFEINNQLKKIHQQTEQNISKQQDEGPKQLRPSPSMPTISLSTTNDYQPNSNLSFLTLKRKPSRLSEHSLIIRNQCNELKNQRQETYLQRMFKQHRNEILQLQKTKSDGLNNFCLKFQQCQVQKKSSFNQMKSISILKQRDLKEDKSNVMKVYKKISRMQLAEKKIEQLKERFSSQKVINVTEIIQKK